MSAISGIVNINSVIKDRDICQKMSDACCRIKKDFCYKSYISENAHLSASSETDIPVTKVLNGIKYTIVYDGELYNTEELKSYLGTKTDLTGMESEAEILLLMFHIMGNSFLKILNGVFSIAIWNENASELTLARDRFGVKPLYYSIIGKTLVFSSEIKGILASEYVTPELDSEGLYRLFGLGPALEQGSGVIKNIYEILPAAIATYNSYGLNEYKYWNLKSEAHTDSLEDTAEKVFSLTTDAIKRQTKISDSNLCCFLSGGLDSSIITAITAGEYPGRLNTYSVEYTGNSEYFKPNEYQPNSDIEYIRLMSDTFNTNHNVIEIGTSELKNQLYNALTSRDIPGMGDIDSSLYCFCEKVGKDFPAAMSGECADEVFGGYPWFHRKEDFDANTFPWSKNIDFRCNIINSNVINTEKMRDFIADRYQNSVIRTPAFCSDNDEEKRRREIAYLNINWFMYSLGARSERIGMKNGLNIRMPFCDYKLVEYVWNIPWEFKAYGGREKGLLRKCFANVLPEEILLRKKSPYPKTHNPAFENLVKEELINILNEPNRKILNIINQEYLKSLMNENSDYSLPWFGQLMAIPQLYAYMIQIDYWLENYKINLVF